MKQYSKTRETKWIVLEGVDKAGKTTAGKLLSKHLESKHGFSVCYKHIFDTTLGINLRKLFLSTENASSLCEAMLLVATRIQYFNEVINGNKYFDVIITDRYMDSICCMQGSTDPLVVELIKIVERNLNRTPDKIILFDVDPKYTFNQCVIEDRIENKPLEFHQKVRENHLYKSLSSSIYTTINSLLPIYSVIELCEETILSTLQYG